MDRRAALLLLFVAAICRRSVAMSVNVHGTECLYEYVFSGGDTVSGNFVVHEHGSFWKTENVGIDFEITSPSNSMVISLKATSGDKFEFKARNAGMYKFCFHSLSSMPDVVSFHVHVGHIPTDHDLAKDEHLSPIQTKIAVLREALEYVITEQKFMKARETRHRHTNESTRKRLWVYTVAEYAALVCISGLQVFYIKNLFSKSVKYNRV